MVSKVIVAVSRCRSLDHLLENVLDIDGAQLQLEMLSVYCF